MRTILPCICAAFLVSLHVSDACASQEVPSPACNETVRLTAVLDSLELRRGEIRLLSVPIGSMDAESRSAISWRSCRPTVATVDQAGRVRARALGTTDIIASREGIRETIRVKVVDFSTPEATAATSNEPPGFTRVTERKFEELREDGWTVSGGLELEEVGAAGMQQLARTAGTIRFPRGFRGGRTPAWTTLEGIDELGLRQLYVSFLVKLSHGWQGHETGVNKIGFIWVHDKPVVVPNHKTRGRGPIVPDVRVQDTPVGTRILSPNVSALQLKRGVWHRWEILLRANSKDRSDGEVHWWIDGVKAGEYHDVLFGDRDQEKRWQIIAWRPTWGGAGDVVRRDMYMWMAHLYVSGSREP